MANNSDSILEVLLADALTKNGISFEQQHRVYERPGDLMPKYTLDFMIRAGKKMIDVECDGKTYHTNPKKKKTDDYRNAWLYTKGFAMILRFDTTDIKYNMNYCINTIKKTISAYTGEQFLLQPENPNIASYRKANRTGYIENVPDNSKLNKVNIYAASFALSYDNKSKGVAVFQLQDMQRDFLSKEFIIAYTGVTVKICQALSVLEALRKMKKPSELTIYTGSRWIANACNDNQLFEKSRRLADKALFTQINNELKRHNYKFVYLKKNDGRYLNSHFNTLFGRAKQKLRQVPDEEFTAYDINML